MQRPRNAARLAAAIACAAAVLATATATPAHADKNDAPAIRSLQKTLLGKVSRLNEDNRIKPVHPREFADVEYLAVYYSAHWCPPCRDFTPKLASFYNDFKPDHPNFELVFLSNDRDARAQREYVTEYEMPWLVLNYRITDTSPLRQFDGHSIPGLVLLDKQGNVLAHSHVDGEYVGPYSVINYIRDNVPSPNATDTGEPDAPTHLHKPLANRVSRLGDDGELHAVQPSELEGIEHLAVYYSAHWCGPCRQFTPELVAFYNEFKADNPNFELVFVSSDRSDQDMQKYVAEAEMPWLVFDYDKAQATPLKRHAGPGIPCLVLLDAAGQVAADSYVDGQYVGPRTVIDYIRENVPAATAVADAATE